MSEHLCIAAGCRSFGHHLEACMDDQCRGCGPRLAAPGLNLCDYHTTHIGLDAVRSAEMWTELEQILAAPERPGERTTGSPDHGTKLNQKAVAMRKEIRHVLANWCTLIAETRGLTLPAPHVDALGAYLMIHREWLAANPLAKDVAGELNSLKHRAWNAAYPTGARIFEVGPCPTCYETLTVIIRDVDSLLPSELICAGTNPHPDGCECGACPPHKWPAHRWRELGKHRYLSAREISDQWKIPAGTVYWLASDRRWRRTQDGRRPVLYLLEDVRASLDKAKIAKDDPVIVG